MRDRECYACGTNKTYIYKTKKDTPYAVWHSNKIKDQWLCHKCNTKLIFNPIISNKCNPRHMGFTPLHKIVYLENDPRIGVCNWCRAVRGIDCKQTAMHHDEGRYDINNILRYTIEICASCHTIYHNITGRT